MFVTNFAFRPFPMSAPFFAGLAAVYTVWFPPEAARRKYFIEANAAGREMGSPGSRLRSILVPPACGGIASVA